MSVAKLCSKEWTRFESCSNLLLICSNWFLLKTKILECDSKVECGKEECAINFAVSTEGPLLKFSTLSIFPKPNVLISVLCAPYSSTLDRGCVRVCSSL